MELTADFFQQTAKVFTVSELTRSIRGTLETKFAAVWVQGEISNFKLHPSGHRYFTLKDQRAQISCVIWRDTMLGFLSGHAKVNALLVPYEDLCSGTLPLAAVGDYLGLKLDPTVLQVRVGAAARPGGAGRAELGEPELEALEREVEPVAGQLGYRIDRERRGPRD